MNAVLDKQVWMDTCIYARKSTHKFAQRESVENQLSICSGEAPRRMLRIVDTKKDTATGTDDLNRPEVKEMIEDAVAGKFKCILMKGISRFFRDVEKGLTLIKMLDRHGIRIVTLEEGFDSLTDRTANGKLDTSKITMYLMFAEMESKKTGDRVKFTQLDKARRGEWNQVSSVPYGYAFNSETKKLMIDDAKADTIRLIYSLYSEGLGLRSIQYYLNGDNEQKRVYPAPKGGLLWNQYTLGFILRNQAYVGDVVYNKRSKKERAYKQPELIGKTKDDIYIGNDYNAREDWIVAKDAHEPIIDRDTFDTVNEILKNKGSRKGVRNNVALLASIGKCSECGASLTFKRGNRDPETGWIKTRSNYYCTNYIKYGRKGCTSHHVSAEELEREVIRDLQHLRMSPDLLQRMFDENRATATSGGDRALREKKKIEKDVKQLSEKIDKLLEKNMAGKISDEQFDLMNAKYREELDGYTSRINVINKSEIEVVTMSENEDRFKKNLDRMAMVEDMKIEQKRLLMLALVDRVELTREGDITIYYRFGNILQS